MKQFKIVAVLSFIVLCIAVIAYGVFYQDSPEEPGDAKQDWQYDKVPNLILTDIRGEKITVGKLEGKVIILNFWATWCEPCRKEFPSMLKLAHASGDKLVLLTISNDDTKQELLNFLKTFNKDYSKELASPNLHIVWDSEQQIASEMFNVFKFPESIIIDKNLNMIRKIAGGVDWESGEIKAYLNSLF